MHSKRENYRTRSAGSPSSSTASPALAAVRVSLQLSPQPSHPKACVRGRRLCTSMVMYSGGARGPHAVPVPWAPHAHARDRQQTAARTRPSGGHCTPRASPQQYDAPDRTPCPGSSGAHPRPARLPPCFPGPARSLVLRHRIEGRTLEKPNATRGRLRAPHRWAARGATGGVFGSLIERGASCVVRCRL